MKKMKQILLSFALFLHASKKYKKIKNFIHDILNNPNNPYKKYVDLSIIFLIVTSVVILIYEVKNPVPEWLDIYDIYFVSFVFSIEYLLRLWVHNDVTGLIIKEYKEAEFLQRSFSPMGPLKKGLTEKLKYMVTPPAIIDLLAIFPAYRPLRVLRIFVLFRVLKLLRYTKSIKQFTEVLSTKKFELLTLLFLLFFIVMTAGIAIYVLEERLNPNIESLFDALYWAFVTISTVGYGDISPVTTEGRTISGVVIISGIAMISFATSVIVSAFSEKLGELKENRIIEQVNKSESFLIVCGYGQMTKMFFRQNEGPPNNYIILENSFERVEQARKDGYQAIYEDASRYDTLSKFNTEHSQITILCLTASDIENIYITLNAKSISSKIRVIARASSDSMVSKFEHAGADHILRPNMVANTMIHTAITQPTMYKAIHAILTGKNIARIDELHVYEYDSIVGKSIKELDFKSFKLLFMGIQRGGSFIFNPPHSETVNSHDILLVMGRQISLDYFKKNHGGIV
jgi:voltage-gated potassium channel